MDRKGVATLEVLARIPGKAEVVGGEIVRMTPAGGRHGFAAGEIFASLREYARRTGLGCAIGENVGFRVELPNRQSFSPDAAYYLGVLSSDFLEGAPVFAVEIRSKGDYGPAAEERLAAKRADYFAAGTLVVWDVDIEQSGWVRVYRAVDSARHVEYRRGAHAEAEPAVPGWFLAVNDLFPPDRG
ncbi:MAG: Uma2 family endonuclease [Vicinamibacterales bacterium]